MQRLVTVIGGGVSGLTSALVLALRGYPVEVLTREAPAKTTSAVAAAFWYPYRVEPVSCALDWGRVSYERFRELAVEPDAGIQFVPATIVFRDPVESPVWAPAVPGFRLAEPAKLPDGFLGGYQFDTAVIEMPVYLDYLTRRLERLGVPIIRREVATLGAVDFRGGVVVNCAGLGARELVGDPLVRAVRGQVARCSKLPYDHLFFDPENPDGTVSYVVPRSADCVLGGTAEEDDEDTTPRPEATAALVERCAKYEPRSAGVTVLDVLVGLRPYRSRVRVEAETLNRGRLIIHNYGHGGAGVTLSWGCAEEVSRIVSTDDTRVT
jgi:D-amino-acid oxidase